MQKVTLLNASSELELNLDQGAQINKLSLRHPKTGKKIPVVSPFDPNKSFFLSGNFLMFPWVNRLESDKLKIVGKTISIEPLEKDTHSQPIHGLYFNKKRRLIEVRKNSAHIELTEVNPNFPQLSETYTLEDNYLSIQTEIHNPSSQIQEFAYGYHPYLRLNANLDECIIHTNLTHYIPLDGNSLPIKSLEKRDLSYLFTKGEPIGSLKLDHLLTGNFRELYFGIYDPKDRLLIQVRVPETSQMPMPYFQVYIPEDRKSIAIEPMTSTGNAFFTPKSGLCKIAPGERAFGEFLIELKILPIV
ncbi:MAG TPA: hypothetical protein PK079_24670 [Leptospiraceae bacterium]|nr:hypothetical protein [Leptospiraceae bacterium]HMW04695.1 hypothetical protein [Leptospiraceae bacterium]HMX31726.1 hypothetical protein [Leptospiraceae bacterium]HMY30532.1 hypothetical protein [Leptospiraceae bacterium]HMZ64167.1 hypothetical protein [Leptospiraceae bacterium]